MAHAQFQAAVLEILRNYWRIKAANALYRSLPELAQGRLEYTNVPAVGVIANQFASESVADAASAIQGFVATRLPRDLFFSLIAEFEGRIAGRLAALGEPSDGTFGNLQTRIQAKLGVSAALAQDCDELRERRNAMIHHADTATLRYVAAATAIAARAAPYVHAPAVGDNIKPTEAYLAYAADVMCRYSSAIG